ncbi:hypothetical protein D3C86_2105290 [compost metagenome]
MGCGKDRGLRWPVDMEDGAVARGLLQMMYGAALASGQNQRDLAEQLRGFIHIEVE